MELPTDFLSLGKGSVIYSLLEDVEMKAKVSSLTRRLEELEMGNLHEVQAVAKTPCTSPALF